MGTTLRLIGLMCLVLAFTGIAQAKEWRGIVPLHSTREDVEKLLGAPQPPPRDWFYKMYKGFSMYFLEEGVVRIDFAEAVSAEADDCLKMVPAGSVVLIMVIPKQSQRVDELQVKGFEKFNPSVGKYPEYQAYYDEKDRAYYQYSPWQRRRDLLFGSFEGQTSMSKLLPQS